MHDAILHYFLEIDQPVFIAAGYDIEYTALRWKSLKYPATGVI
jgi:hypothetical protein